MSVGGERDGQVGRGAGTGLVLARLVRRAPAPGSSMQYCTAPGSIAAGDFKHDSRYEADPPQLAGSR